MLHQDGFGVKFIKDYNELNVLRFIKDNAPVSRAEISKKYHLSKAAVSDISARLLTQGYIHEVGVGNSTRRGGRRPILLRFNQGAGYVVALEIKRAHARVALLDMEAKVHDLVKVNFHEGCCFDIVMQAIVPVIKSFLRSKWVHHARPIGIGIGIPGIINYDLGCIKVSDTLHSWENVPIRSLFEKEFGLKVVLENDVKTMTLGECLFGKGKNYNNLVNLWIGDGIGAGIIINGVLLRGITASAGEVGYDELGFFIRNGKDFPLLYRGQKDFGDILSNRLLLASAAEAIEQGYQTELKKDDLNLDQLIDAAEREDPLAICLLREYANLLGILCINLINMLNIELLVLSGELAFKSNKLIEFVRERVHQDILHEPAQAVKILPGCLNEEGVVMGAAGLVLEDLFYQDNVNVVRYRSIFK